MGEFLCPACFARVSFTTYCICVVCNKHSLDGKTHPGCLKKYSLDGCFAAIVYQGVTKRLIYQYKYQPYLTSLTPLLTDLFYEGIIQQEVAYSIFSRKPLFVPVPLHVQKLRERGYNQSLLLANALAKRFDSSVKEVLQRVKKTPTQTKLTREQRIKNVAGAFALRPQCGNLIKDKELVLIDDVLTSGATFQEAAHILKHAGARNVWGFALAHEE